MKTVNSGIQEFQQTPSAKIYTKIHPNQIAQNQWQEGVIIKEQKEIFRGDGYVHFLKCGGSSPAVHICLITDMSISETISSFKYVRFIICQLYHNKADRF